MRPKRPTNVAICPRCGGYGKLPYNLGAQPCGKCKDGFIKLTKPQVRALITLANLSTHALRNRETFEVGVYGLPVRRPREGVLPGEGRVSLVDIRLRASGPPVLAAIAEANGREDTNTHVYEVLTP